MGQQGPFEVANVPAAQACNAGFAQFNGGEHLLVSVPDGHSTISVRLSNGRLVTFAFTPYVENGCPQGIDIQDHGGPEITADDVKTPDDQAIGRPRQRVLCFSQGGTAFSSERPDERERKLPVTLVALRIETPGSKDHPST